MLKETETVEAVLDHEAMTHEAHELLLEIRSLVKDDAAILKVIAYGHLNYKRGVLSRVK